MDGIIRFNTTMLKAVGKDGEMLSLNDLWKLVGSPKYKEPKRWVQLPDSVKYIKKEIEIEKDEKSVFLSKKGRNGGSYANRRVFLEYARYLNKDLAVQINEVFLQEIEAQKNPDLYLDKYRSAYRKQGKDDKWISERMKGMDARKGLTSTLSSHGVTGDGFRVCTNASYTGLFGMNAPAIRKTLGIEKKDSIRDNLTRRQLLALSLAEDLANDDIEQNALWGTEQCAQTCHDASKTIYGAVAEYARKRNLR